MPTTPASTYPRTDFGNLQWTSANASAVLGQKAANSAVPTIPTSAGTTAVTLIAPVTGTLTAAKFAAKDALATHASNLVTWAIVNKGQAGAGTTAMLAATAANTTNSTGGTALAAYTTRNLTLHGTAANLAVTAGDVLEFQVIGSGTLANTITQGSAQLLFSATA